MTPTQYICPGDSAFVSVIASGGYGNYYYLWPSNGATTPGIWVYPGSTNSYQVLVSDECQSFNVSGFSQVQIVKPVADFTILTTNPTENLPTSFYNLTQNGFGYQWFFGDGSGSYEVHPTHTFSPYGEYFITLIATDTEIVFEISNSKPESVAESEKGQGGIGLANLKKRLDIIYPEKYSLEVRDEDSEYHVKLALNT
jgi:PKD repeat protein